MIGTDIPLYGQIAEDYRKRIANGELRPGAQLPPEAALVKQYHAARETVRAALQVLRTEGLIVTRHGHGTYVRQAGERERVTLGTGEQAIARMPTPDERRKLDLDDGMPVCVVTGADGRTLCQPRGNTATVRAVRAVVQAVAEANLNRVRAGT